MISWNDFTIELVHTTNSYPTKNPDATTVSDSDEMDKTPKK